MKSQKLLLLRKEFLLGNTVQTICWTVCCFSMFFLPSYPMYVGPFYITLCIFMSFALNQASHDILYTVLLPVKKSDVVLARFLYCGMLELFAFACALIACFVKRLGNFPVNKAGIDITISYFGLQMILFSVFNLIFLGNVYKNPLKVGLRFLVASILYFAVYALSELPVWIYTGTKTMVENGELSELLGLSKLGYIFTGDCALLLPQLVVLVSGLVIYILVWLWSYCRAIKQFTRYDM